VTVRLGPAPRLGILLAIVATIVVAAAMASTIFGGPRRQIETGVVIAVQATSLTDVQGFSIRTSDGRTVDFRAGPIEDETTFPPGHLAEHKVSLSPVRVTYVDRDAAHVAVRLEDGP